MGLICPKDADVCPDQEQSDLDVYCLQRPICPISYYFYGMFLAPLTKKKKIKKMIDYHVIDNMQQAY